MIVIALKDGPLLLDGPVTIKNEDGKEIMVSGKVALCRCGASDQKPLCDGSHKGCKFEASQLEITTDNG